jgi:hypothetical protein
VVVTAAHVSRGEAGDRGAQEVRHVPRRRRQHLHLPRPTISPASSIPALRSIQPMDFEMVDGGQRIDINQLNCVRTVVSN